MSDDIEKAVGAVESKLDEAVKKYEAEVQNAGTASQEAKAAVDKLSQQLSELTEGKDGLEARMKEVEQRAAEGFQGAGEQKTLSWGQSFVESEQFKEAQQAGSLRGKSRVEVKNTILGESGGDPENTLVPQDRLPGIVPGAFRALTILDFVPMGATSSNQIEYTREASWSNASAETIEGATKPESDLTFELVNDPVRTIAHWLRVSRQVLDDAPALSSYIDRRLRHGVRQRLQRQIVQGGGVSPNLAGVTSTGRHTAFTPESGDQALDSMNRAKYAIIGADYAPNFIWINPADWGVIERLKASDDSYLAGGGAALSYINQGMTPVVWGVPVVSSNDIPEGQFVMGDTNAMQLFMRQGAVVEMFEQDADNVTQNLITVRAEVRGAFAVFTPQAIQYGDLVSAT